MGRITTPIAFQTSDVEEKLETCLKALLEHTRGEAELIIVEQGKPASGATSLAASIRARLVSTMVFVRLKYFWYSGPIGYAKAVNVGVRASEGEHLLIVNNDIVVHPGWAEKLVRTYDSIPFMGMLSACDLPGPETDMVELNTSWWSCACISRDTWEKIGALDEEKLNFRLHDQDWDIRAYRMGYEIGRYHGVKVQHEESSTYRHMAGYVDESGERVEMRRRWGFEHFVDYARLYPFQDRLC